MLCHFFIPSMYSVFFSCHKFILQFSFHLISFLISCCFCSSFSFVPFFCPFFLSFIFLSLSGRDVGSILCLTSPFSYTQPPANKSRTGDLWPGRSMLALGPRGSVVRGWRTLIGLQNTASDFRHHSDRWTGVIGDGMPKKRQKQHVEACCPYEKKKALYAVDLHYLTKFLSSIQVWGTTGL